MPVSLPQGVTATVTGDTVTVKGAKGTLSLGLRPGLKLVQEAGSVRVEPAEPTRESLMHAGSLRSHLAIPPYEAVDLYMPAYLSQDGEALVVKVVAVYPNNPANGLPTIHATVLVSDARTGAPLALLGTKRSMKRPRASVADMRCTVRCGRHDRPARFFDRGTKRA